jgi:TolB-like protein/Tfp pilus assembly protein PilF
MRADLRRLLRDAASGRASSAGTGRVRPALPSRRGLVVAALAAVLVLALGGVWLARRGRDAATAPTSATASKRVAVLPFENLGAAEDAYFADGVTDEVRSKLTGLPGLAVIARASAEHYKGSTKSADAIAKELGVGYLLTAKVRWQKTGTTSRIRVTPELAEVSGGGALTTRWQDAFDANLEDVFQVQGEIATKVAQSLEVALGTRQRERLGERPTSNLAAWDAYLRGQEFDKQGNDPATLRLALAQYEQAVALDPAFALAWAALSIDRSLIYFNASPSPAEADAARTAAERALALSPELPEGHLARGTYHRLVTSDFQSAWEAYSQGLRTWPGNAGLLRGSALTEEGLGRWEAALEQHEQARDIDPRAWRTHLGVGQTLLRLRRPREAREALDRALEVAPTNLTLIESKAMTYLAEGDLAGARRVLDLAPKQVQPTALVAFLGTYQDLHWVLDEPRRQLLLRLTPAAFGDDKGNWGLVMAQAHALYGDKEKVKEYAEEARRVYAHQIVENPDAAQARVLLGLMLAYLGRGDEAVREGERGVGLAPISKNARSGPYYQHQLVRIHILLGNREKALDLLGPLLTIPYHLTPGWLRIDPNFDPLRGNPRFERLVKG